MCSESLPMEFVKDTELVPLPTHGLSTMHEFQRVENEHRYREILKKAGLTDEELRLYEDNKTGRIDYRSNIESRILKNKLEAIYEKINLFHSPESSNQNNAGHISKIAQDPIEELNKKNPFPLPIYPAGHPMNHLKKLEEDTFANIEAQSIPISVTKRRKIWRRLERKKEKLCHGGNQINCTPENINASTSKSKDSLWDMIKPRAVLSQSSKMVTKLVTKKKKMIGPKLLTMYTVKDNKIVRLEPIKQNEDEYVAVDIIVPVNAAEQNLLEGTKMCMEDIKKIERFKDYEPGVPSKILYLKNIATTVSQEQLSLLFNQFILDNKGPVDVKLMTGRMRGQAFVVFNDENLAIQALEEINGTILSGRPIIAQFGRNSNRIQET